MRISIWLFIALLSAFLFSCTPTHLELESGKSDPSSSSEAYEVPDATPEQTPNSTPVVEVEPTPTPEPTVEPTPEPDLTRYSIAVMKQSQILRSYGKCLGLTAAEISQTTLDTYGKVRPNLPRFGKVKEISAPFFMSTLQLVGDICTDLIRKEEGQRKFFKGFSINSNNSNDSFSVDATIQSLAGACWGRAPSSEETDILKNGFLQSELGSLRNEKAALFICASTLASAEAVRY